mgnify:CR=1 FL=1
MTIWNANQNLPGQTGDNVIIGGATYAIATDWGSGGGTGFTGAHVQIVKLGWGDTSNTYRASKLNPIPVVLFDGVQGTTGALIDSEYNALKITGGVHFNKKLEIAGGQLDAHTTPSVSGIIQIVGPTFGKSGPTAYGPGRLTEAHFAPIKVTGSVQGIANGTPVAVTWGTTADGGLIRRLYGGPIGYDGRTGTDWEYANRNVLDRDIDYIAVQGIDKGYPIGITGTTGGNGLHASIPTRGLSYGASNRDNTYGDSVRVYGQASVATRVANPIEVTGGIVVASMPAGASFEVRNMTYGRDSVAIGGLDGTTAAQVKLLSGNGTPIGVSAGALKVAVDNGAFNITANVYTNTYVHNATGGAISVRGITSEHVTVIGPLSGGALEVSSPSGLNTRSLSSSTDNVELGGNSISYLQSIKSDADKIKQYQDATNVNLNELENMVTDMSLQIQSFHNEFISGGSNTHPVQIKETVLPNTLVSKTITVSAAAVAFPSAALKSGVNVQSDPTNTVTVYIGGGVTMTKSTGYSLEPGDTIFLEIDDLNRLSGKSSTSLKQRINIIGS